MPASTEASTRVDAVPTAPPAVDTRLTPGGPGYRRMSFALFLAGVATFALLYSTQALVIATGVFEDEPLALYALLVVGALVWATLWRRWRSQGPLEELVARAAGRARRAVLGNPATRVGAVDRE